jgi:hypothetical protein
VKSFYESKISPSAAATNTWKLDGIQVESVPDYYYLERTHAVVENATPQVVATRVSSYFREASIAASYDESEALVDAETSDGVEFCVRLWAVEANTNQVIVEVQRVSGCSFNFCQSAKSILRASKGLASPNACSAPQFTIPKGIPRPCLQDEERNMQEGLSIAISLLNSDRLDCNALAMESLVKLTSLGSDFRALAARTILRDETLEKIVAMIENTSEQAAFSAVDELKFDSMMHRHALVVLSNCLSALSEHGSSDLEMLMFEGETFQRLQSQQLLFALVDDVTQCIKKPHEACQAIKCLRSMTSAHFPTKKAMLDMGAANAISMAQNEGFCRHNNLYKESQLLWRDIEDVRL